MTFPDDFARMYLATGMHNLTIRGLGLEWPPPEYLYIAETGPRQATDDEVLTQPGFVMRRISMSEISDGQRAGMTHVCRGAEYRYLIGGLHA